MSFDFLEDACDTLDKTDASYIVLFFIPESTKTLVVSNLGDNAPGVHRMVLSGEMEGTLLTHLKEKYPDHL